MSYRPSPGAFQQYTPSTSSNGYGQQSGQLSMQNILAGQYGQQQQPQNGVGDDEYK